jgi:polysaccharide export outer membrane protein
MKRGCLALLLLLMLGACSPVADRAVVHDAPQGEALVAGMSEKLSFPIPQDVPPEIASGYRFAHGDRLVISVLGLDDTKRMDVLVDPDGNISYLHLRAVPAVGRTSEELALDLGARLKDLYLEPVVAVRPDVVKGNVVFVVGEVRTPGTVPYERQLRVLDAFAMAGGLGTARVENRTRQVADLDHTTLLRKGEPIPLDFRALVLDGDLRHNITLHPADIILVGSLVNAEIYVLGAVRTPGSRKLTAGLTLMGALAKTGGLDQRAYRQSIAVLRGNMARPEIFVVDVERILRAEALDFPLRAGDVVYIPDRPFNYARELAVVAMRAFVGVVAGKAGFEAYDRL